ncbi:MAG TPA: hypothetical protein VKB51_13225 [bacterium]|nr:hypothetical protein [bacterium]
MERLCPLSAPARPASLVLHPLRATLARALPALLLAAVLLAPLVASTPARAETPDRLVGTYRIQSWDALESRGLYHFFYLAPDGHFLLAAEWPGKERSHFVGTWDVNGDVVTLTGRGHVKTNEGTWDTPFQRKYRIQLEGGGFVIAPEPQKNRYGLMGWPQYYRFYRREPAPNLPDVKLPADPAAMAKYIDDLLAQQK